MRNQSTILPKLAIGLLALILVAGAGGYAVILTARRNVPFRNLPEFPLAEYRQGDPVWNNSSYILSGTLDNIILESKDRKRYLVAITTKGSGAPLPVVIPARVPKSPLQRQQKLSLKVTVDSSGRIVASDCETE